MDSMEVFNLDDNIKKFKNETNKDDLDVIVEKFKSGNFQQVLEKTKQFRKNHEVNEQLATVLSLIDTTCHSQIGEKQQAVAILMNLYNNAQDASIDDLILYGNFAFMCDYKLARRIMSDVVKRMEKEETYDREKLAHSYLMLGEAEENLEKYIRAIRYYKRGLAYFEEVQKKE